MRFGFFVMPCHDPVENPALTFARDLDMVEYAESLAYDEVWVGEHHTGGWETIPAPDIFLSAIAQRTKRIRMGTGVISLPFYHPFQVAERMAFLDQLSFGRVILGVGPGILASDSRLFGMDPEAQRPMMGESLEIIMKLLREDGPVSYEGKYWTVNGMELQVKPYQDPMPVAVASSGKGITQELIAKYGLSMLTGNFFGEAQGEALGQRWHDLEDAATVVGNKVDRSEWRIATHVYVADSNEEAFADIEAGAQRQIGDYFYNLGSRQTLEPYRTLPGGKVDVERLAGDASWIIGDPDYCARRIEQMNNDTGGFGGLLMIAGEWSTREKWLKSMDLFARHVAPRFKKFMGAPQRAFQKLVEFNDSGNG